MSLHKSAGSIKCFKKISLQTKNYKSSMICIQLEYVIVHEILNGFIYNVYDGL